jgi:uncharacterized membrane protein
MNPAAEALMLPFALLLLFILFMLPVGYWFIYVEMFDSLKHYLSSPLSFRRASPTSNISVFMMFYAVAYAAFSFDSITSNVSVSDLKASKFSYPFWTFVKTIVFVILPITGPLFFIYAVTIHATISTITHDFVTTDIGYCIASVIAATLAHVLVLCGALHRNRRYHTELAELRERFGNG